MGVTFVLVFVLWLFSLCLHEYSHARVAYAAGDWTVKKKGYLSFDPLKYTHPVYSILIPLLFLVMGGIGLPGGAVYIEDHRIKSKRLRSAVSLAGPASNLLLALIIGRIFHYANYTDNNIWAGIAFVGLLQVTAVLFNLLPIPPFDGFGIIEPWLNEDFRKKAREMGSWSIWVVYFALMYLEPVSRVFWNTVYFISDLIGIPNQLAYEGFQAMRLW
ncbi:MAG: site-2 protease family protein [Planctomycetes bacterium]|nr:site-2 protease family protein [Planctomycetota bacterium]